MYLDSLVPEPIQVVVLLLEQFELVVAEVAGVDASEQLAEGVELVFFLHFHFHYRISINYYKFHALPALKAVLLIFE